MANDHYVPRFYLKNFAVADKPGRVWCYQRNRRPTLRGVKSVASEEDYYSLKEADDAFKQIETDSSPIIKRLITTTKMDLTEDECITTSWFIASLLCRTPWYEKNQIRGHLEGLRHYSEVYFK